MPRDGSAIGATTGPGPPGAHGERRHSHESDADSEDGAGEGGQRMGLLSGRHCDGAADSGEDVDAGAGFHRRHEALPGGSLLLSWALLAIACCAISSAGAVFKTMPLVPPLTRAAWRLQVNGV